MKLNLLKYLGISNEYNKTMVTKIKRTYKVSNTAPQRACNRNQNKKETNSRSDKRNHNTQYVFDSSNSNNLNPAKN